MHWLKKYYEKILLAGALLFLILVAAGLVIKINRLNAEIQDALHPPEPPDKPILAAQLASYSNAIAALQSPLQWTNPNATLLFPPIPVKTAITTTVIEVATPRPLITLTGVSRRPFTLQFKAYVWDANANEGRSFQVNFLTENRSFFVEKVGVEIADRHGKTGYFITKFNRKTTTVVLPGIGSKTEQDTSELTVKHENEDPITLTLGKLAVYPKRYARIQTPDGPIELPLGNTFDTGGKTYKVIDITDKEVIILELKSGEKQTLSLMSFTPMPVFPGVVPREAPRDGQVQDALRERDALLKSLK